VVRPPLDLRIILETLFSGHHESVISFEKDMLA